MLPRLAIAADWTNPAGLDELVAGIRKQGSLPGLVSGDQAKEGSGPHVARTARVHLAVRVKEFSHV
jgi:hypothetical protein